MRSNTKIIRKNKIALYIELFDGIEEYLALKRGLYSSNTSNYKLINFIILMNIFKFIFVFAKGQSKQVTKSDRRFI